MSLGIINVLKFLLVNCWENLAERLFLVSDSFLVAVS